MENANFFTEVLDELRLFIAKKMVFKFVVCRPETKVVIKAMLLILSPLWD
jgi:hypothetical protein